MEAEVYFIIISSSIMFLIVCICLYPVNPAIILSGNNLWISVGMDP